MKKVFMVLLCLTSFSCFAATATTPLTNGHCPQTVPTNDYNFCASFKESAICHCTSMGLPLNVCRNMEDLNARMISMFGSLERACAFQKETAQQTCIDDWNCYLNGGEDSQGRLCSSTGASCD
jgi:hypothetical protein